MAPKKLSEVLQGNDGSLSLPGPWNLDAKSRVLIWHQKIAYPPLGLLNQSYLKNSQGKTVAAQSYYHFDTQTQEALIVVYPSKPLKSAKSYKWITEWTTQSQKKPLKTVSQELLLR
jgi:hypothetical protein